MGKMFESTPAYQKGLIGEEIVKKYLESRELLVRRPDDTATSGASVVDFFVEEIVGEGDEEWTYSYYVEVKVKSSTPYAYGRFSVYTFPKSQIELYKRYAKEKDSHIEIFIVDEKRESIFVGLIGACPGIEDPSRIEDKTFPVDVEQSNGIYRYYHVEQFKAVAKINPADFARLNTIKMSETNKVTDKSFEILDESQLLVLEHLNITLPNDLPQTQKKIVSFANSLRPMFERLPWFLCFNIHLAINHIRDKYSTWNMIAFAKNFDIQYKARHNERSKINQPSAVITLKKAVTKIAELQTPSGTKLNLFNVDRKIFVKVGQLALAFGYKNEGAGGSDDSNLGESVCKVSQRYSIFIDNKFRRVVKINDVYVIVSDYMFNREGDSSRYEAAKEFLAWWEQAAEPYLEPLPEEKPSANSFTAEEIQTIKELADSIQIKTRELNRELASLAELLAKL